MRSSITSLAGTASISAMNFRKEPGRYLDRVSYRGESFVIERAGEAKAALVPLHEYQEMRRLKQEAKEDFFSLTKELREAFKGKTPNEIEEEIQKAVDEVRKSKKPLRT